MRSLAIAATIAFLAASAQPALADKKSDADGLFKKGKKLHADKRYAAACVLFEKSDGLDPQIGTKLNAAKCYEDWGRLASAMRWYAAAEQLAEQTRDRRVGQIRELIEALDPDVPRLTVKVPPKVDLEAAAITLDGKPLSEAELGKEQLVDPGPHELVYFVDGERQSKLVPMERGGGSEITLDIPPGKQRKPRKTPPNGGGGGGSDDPPPAPGRTRRILALSMGAAGVVGLGVASYLTIDARGTYQDALETHCMGMTNACSDEGLRITADARSQANTATIITLVSAAVIGGGVVLYLTSPKGGESAEQSAIYVTPVVTDRGGALVVGGGF